MIENKNIGWQRVLKIIIPYIFIVGIFQTVGLFITGVGYGILHHAFSFWSGMFTGNKAASAECEYCQQN